MKTLPLFFVLATICFAQTSFAFQSTTRWLTTATDGPGLTQGDPTTLTWGFVPDGTPASGTGGTSNLLATLDSWYGAGPGGSDLTQRPWFGWFEQSFDRYAQLSGLSYVYEPNDDGATQSTTIPGILGVRADVRIAGSFIDGNSNTLAFNDFPTSGGDMTFDTGDNFFTNSSNNNRRLRNVTMHEHGHGTGFRHVESNSAAFLMEPFVNTTFDGLQFDDLLGVQRLYGDFYEKSNNGAGNNSSATATDLGSINNTSAAIGTQTSNLFTAVAATNTDYVSIDDNSDLDFYSFTIDGGADVDITLEPRGPTYNQGPQGGGQSSYQTKNFSDLTLALIDTNGSTELITSNSGGLGATESITNFSLSGAGQYYVRVTGTANMVQMYRLTIETELTALAGDFSGDGMYGCTDVDDLVAEIVAGTNDLAFDLTGDNLVNEDDLTEWLSVAGEADFGAGATYLVGDADLNGTVDGDDLAIWDANKFTSQAAWCLGDFNADGLVNGRDFLGWNANKFLSSDGNLAVPEPKVSVAMLFCLGLLSTRRRS